MYITELKLKTQFLAALRDFYAGTLAFPFDGQTRPFDTIGFKIGHTHLIFEQATDDSEPIYHFAFNIPENQLVEAKMWLSERTKLLTYNGKEIVEWPAWDAHAIYFTDPAGNVAEFIARHGMSNASIDRFDAKSLLGVSEIGIAVENVTEAVQNLHQNLGIDVFDAGDGENFTALGNDNGLFIVVKRGRNWFPTDDKPADLYPVSVSMTGAKSGEYQLPGLPYEFFVG
ncbi:MAG: glyoxalase/bleomycin resistance/dioxygenase family protein [Chloroflexi bacterium]|nr:MAG: glyoxalase/bleomycin resistance/dioxygenase family protein [Chloroflexota bacterium]